MKIIWIMGYKTATYWTNHLDWLRRRNFEVSVVLDLASALQRKEELLQADAVLCGMRVKIGSTDDDIERVREEIGSQHLSREETGLALMSYLLEKDFEPERLFAASGLVSHCAVYLDSVGVTAEQRIKYPEVDAAGLYTLLSERVTPKRRRRQFSRR